MPDELTRRAERWMDSRGMLSGASSVLTAFSGGADSSALLYILAEICPRRGIALSAAHLHHGIRGAEADRDAAHCETVCRELGIPFYLKKADIPAIASERGESVEEAGRRERYAFFDALCREHGIDRVATAHHRDDNAETVLAQLLRGASPGHLGIPPVRGNVIRPLLPFSKEELTAFCAARGIVCVTDSTNDDTAYTRNYVRHVLLPACRKVNPSASEALCRFAELSARDDEVLEEASHGAERRNADELCSLPDALLTRTLRRLYAEDGRDLSRLSGAHIDAMLALIRRRKLHARLDLPGGAVFRLEKEGVTIGPPDDEPPVYDVPLNEGLNLLPDAAALLQSGGDGAFGDEKDGNPTKNIYRFVIRKLFPFDTIKEGITARSRRGGDTMRVRGMTKSVRKLLQECSLPRDTVDRLPFICRADTGEILWIPFVAEADALRENPGSGCASITVFIEQKGNSDESAD